MAKKILECFFFLLILGVSSKAQLTENFNDGDFSNDPAWTGGNSDFIVNTALQLQSNNTLPNNTFFISTPNSLANAVQWEMYLQLAFNPSSANYVDVYLTASAADLTLNTTTGYFVRIGSTGDDICLYRKDATGNSTQIIDGADGILNRSNNVIKIKVTRDEANQWQLFRDLGGTGYQYTSEGSAPDATYTTSAFFGFLVKQSTGSFFQKHFFDDIDISNYIPDTEPPWIQSANAVSSYALDVSFNEPVEAASSEVPGNYSANNDLGSPVSAARDATNPSLVHLTFATAFASTVTYTLGVKGVKDLSGNEMNHAATGFSYYVAQPYDIVIDEIMADPFPPVGLPECEWLELRNTSSFPVNLNGWKIADLTGNSGPLPDLVLLPDSFVTVCSASSLPLLQSFGKVISVTGFPALDNTSDLIGVFSSEGRTIHGVQYHTDWYQNELKQEGGWSLEMIDTKNPCNGNGNWKASLAAAGGTPCRINSVDGHNADQKAPELLRAFPTAAATITLVFNEGLDSLQATIASNYTIDKGISVIHAEAVSPTFDKVIIELDAPLVPGTIYTVAAAHITDCIGNPVGSTHTVRFGLPQEPDSLDLVINEILYHPRPNGVDYVELYNRSHKVVDLNHIYIANRNSANAPGNIQQVSSQHLLFFPGDFVVLTRDPLAVKNQYVTMNPDAFIALSSMPSFSNDMGDAIILNYQGAILDELEYADTWQFPLISNTEGVALERIDYDGPTVRSNFHSAATFVGYGTPGYKNSQYRSDESVKGTIVVTPEIFSPDNDGTDDFATIDYNFPAPGYVANITVFDATGRPVRYLQRNALSGVRGYYRWDGLDDRNRKLPQGIYIIYTEIFNTAGKKKQFKNTIVLARRH